MAFTSAMVPMQDIRRYCAEIAANFKPQRIILFGSHAYGTPTPDSDVDLLVVMPKPRRYWMQTTQKIHEKVSAGFPVDILVRDPAFLRERLHEGDTFLEEITTKGRVMYESRHA
jgi:predicted nucleotidyltransferase